MLTWSNTDNNGAYKAASSAPLFINGQNGCLALWCATGRDLTPGTSGPLGTVANESTRTATTCYMRGLSEHIRIQTSSGCPWFHRRICFTYRGNEPLRSKFEGDTGETPMHLETSSGMVRYLQNINVIAGTANYRNQIKGLIFKGQEGNDWNDMITAPVDNRRVTLKFDKTWTIMSGNANGTVRERKLWHGMNKNLVYDDDEAALTEATTFYSVDSKAGMGDYYVLDIIQAGTGGSTSDLFRMEATSSLYWHEK